MNTANVFKVLDVVDSSNNYAMRALDEGLAGHGDAFFARAQTHGKGQRNKSWHSQPSENLLLSVILKPSGDFHGHPFLFSASVAIIIRDFLAQRISENVNIKWPNDLFVRDRKAGGILIENKFRGSQWSWSVIGVGINVNQVGFPPEAGQPVSVRQITGTGTDPEMMARELHEVLVSGMTNIRPEEEKIMDRYNDLLLGAGKSVRLRKSGETFETRIIRVDQEGFLITQDSLENRFAFGEVEWVGFV